MSAAAETTPALSDHLVAPLPSASFLALLELVRHTLDEGKAEDIVTIDITGRSSLADCLVIASGRSSRQVAALAEQVAAKLKDHGYGWVPIEGAEHGDWVLVDIGDIILHIFRPEVRSYYNLEKMWSPRPVTPAPASAGIDHPVA